MTENTILSETSCTTMINYDIVFKKMTLNNICVPFKFYWFHTKTIVTYNNIMFGLWSICSMHRIIGTSVILSLSFLEPTPTPLNRTDPSLGYGRKTHGTAEIQLWNMKTKLKFSFWTKNKFGHWNFHQFSLLLGRYSHHRVRRDFQNRIIIAIYACDVGCLG